MLFQKIADHHLMPAPAAPSNWARHVKITKGACQLDLSPHRDTIVITLSPATVTALPLVEERQVAQGCLIYFPAGACTIAQIAGPSDVLLVHVEPEVRLKLLSASGLFNPLAPHRVAVVPSHPQIDSTIRLLAYLVASDHETASVCLTSIVRLLLLDIAIDGAPLAESAITPRSGPLDAARLRAIDHFIEDHIEEPMNLEQLSQLAGMSRYHFLRCFKKATGVSPLQYVIARRIDRARQMLREGRDSIAEIAYATGFSSQSHLNAMFKRHVGMTPGSFKRQFRPPMLAT